MHYSVMQIFEITIHLNERLYLEPPSSTLKNKKMAINISNNIQATREIWHCLFEYWESYVKCRQEENYSVTL